MPALRSTLAILAVLVAPLAASGQGSGVSPDGQKGKIHVVKRGDTLWDITAHYLGTPWIWPAIWKENAGIENPHLIYPGDLIWITEGEMRKLTPEEAEAFMRGELELEKPATPSEDVVVAPDAPPKPPDPFGALDGGATLARRALRFHGLQQAPFVSLGEMDAAAAVLGSHAEHYWLAQEQDMIVSLGEGQTHVGDQFSIYRVRRRVSHPETGATIGYFVEVLGLAEISEVFPETSLAKIVLSYSEIEPGDRLTPYERDPKVFTLEPIEGPIEGTIVAQETYRIYSGEGDVVILDRGAEDGLTSGNELVIFREGTLVRDPLSTAHLLQPDDIVGRLFVLKTGARSAVALVTRAHSEVSPGDRFRSP